MERTCYTNHADREWTTVMTTRSQNRLIPVDDTGRAPRSGPNGDSRVSLGWDPFRPDAASCNLFEFDFGLYLVLDFVV